MPCKICGTELVFGDWPGSPKCAECGQINLVSRPLAVEISKKRLDYLDQLLQKYMRQFDKNQLIAHIVWQRELFSRSFFFEYQTFEMSKFVSYSLLIRRLMAEKDFSPILEVNETTTTQLIDTFSTYLNHLTDHIYLEDGISELMAKEKSDPNSMSTEQMLSAFIVVPTEKFLPIHSTFANNEIYDEKEGQRKFEEYDRERKELERNPPSMSSVKYIPEDFITRNYSILNSLYCGLLKNENYAKKTFDFSNYQRAAIVPSKIMDLVKLFRMYLDRPTIRPLYVLGFQLSKVFGGSLSEIESVFVFSEKNQDTFPLFVEMADRVLIPHQTAFVIFLLLHPILHKELFDAETQRRSKELELIKARAAFEDAGFVYYTNLTDKIHASIEIDGIAVRKREMLVVEVKGWGIGTYFEHKERQEWLIRDLKGIVDGWKYSKIAGEEREQRKVSLLEKIEFVRRNMRIWGFDPTTYESVEGIIVIKDYPPISLYKGIKILSVEDVPRVFAES